MAEGRAGDGVWEEADAGGGEDAGEPGPAPPESRPEEPEERAEAVDPLEEAGEAVDDADNGGSDGTPGKAGEDGALGLGEAPPETPRETGAEEGCSTRTLRSDARQHYPDQGPQLKMGARARKWRERIEAEVAGAGLAMEDFPRQWTRSRGGRDVIVSVHVHRLGHFSITKRLSLFALTENEMTEPERDILEEKLLEGLWSKMHRSLLETGKGKRKRAQPTGGPSTSGTADAQSPVAASSWPSPGTDPLGNAGLSAAAVRGRVLDVQRYLKNLASHMQEKLGSRLRAVDPDAWRILEETTQRALENLAQLDGLASASLLPLRRRKAYLSPTTHKDVLKQVAHVLQVLYEELSQALLKQSQGEAASEASENFRQSWAELTELWGRLQEAPALHSQLLPPAASEASHSTASPTPPSPHSSAPSAGGSREVKQEKVLEVDEGLAPVLRGLPRETGEGPSATPREAAHSAHLQVVPGLLGTANSSSGPPHPSPSPSPAQSRAVAKVSLRREASLEEPPSPVMALGHPRPPAPLTRHADLSDDQPRFAPAPPDQGAQAIAQRPSSEDPPHSTPSRAHLTRPPRQARCLFCGKSRQDQHALVHCSAESVKNLRASFFGDTDPCALANASLRYDFFAGLTAMRRSMSS